MLNIKAGLLPTREQLLELYADAGWTAYTGDPDRLERAVRQSQTVYTAWVDGTLAGLLRTVGDGETILYVQDILVLSAYQRRGIGKALMDRMEADHGEVRQKVLSTDDTEKTTAFYRACGWRPMSEFGCVTLLKLYGKEYDHESI